MCLNEIHKVPDTWNYGVKEKKKQIERVEEKKTYYKDEEEYQPKMRSESALKNVAKLV
jgi:hypothetical protein